MVKNLNRLDQELFVRNKYLVAENCVRREQISGRLLLTILVHLRECSTVGVSLRDSDDQAVGS